MINKYEYTGNRCCKAGYRLIRLLPADGCMQGEWVMSWFVHAARLGVTCRGEHVATSSLMETSAGRQGGDRMVCACMLGVSSMPEAG